MIQTFDKTYPKHNDHLIRMVEILCLIRSTVSKAVNKPNSGCVSPYLSSSSPTSPLHRSTPLREKKDEEEKVYNLFYIWCSNVPHFGRSLALCGRAVFNALSFLRKIRKKIKNRGKETDRSL